MSSVNVPESGPNSILGIADQLRLIQIDPNLPADYYTAPADHEALSQRARIIDTIMPRGHRLSGDFSRGATILYGAMTDTMIEAGNEIHAAVQTGELKPGPIVIGAGMRALSGPFDERGLRWLRSRGSKREYITETDAAEGIVEMLFGGFLVDQVTHLDTPGAEAPNQLGPRSWVYRQYEGKDGQEFIVVNGKSVARGTANRAVDSSQNRHTTKSVMEEIAAIMPERTNNDLLIVAASVHALRMGAETAAVLNRQKHEPKITVYPMLATLDKYGANAAKIAREAFLTNVPPRANAVQTTPELAPDEGDFLEYASFQTAMTLLLMEQPSSILEFEPGKPINAYLNAMIGATGDVRRAFDSSKLTAVPEALDRAYNFMRVMGFGSSELGKYTGDRPYAAAIEGGRAVKYGLEFRLIDEQEKAPESIMVYGTPHRVVGRTIEEVAAEFEDSPKGLTDTVKILLQQKLETAGVVTEYDVAEAFARERVVSDADQKRVLAEHYTMDGKIQGDSFNPRRHITYWGKDASGAPVVSVTVDREYELNDGSESYQTLGVSGTLELSDAINQLLREAEILSSEPRIESAVALASSHWYAPTRKLNIEAKNRVAGEPDKFVGLFYGPQFSLPKDAGDLSKVGLSHLASEFRVLMHSVEKTREEAPKKLLTNY